jgi:hypothetical protein
VRRTLALVASVIAVMLVLAAPAYASFQWHVVSGTRGYVGPWDVAPSVQGGVCGDPAQYPASTCGSNRDQIFVSRYQVYSNASAAAQDITSVVYLYYWNGTGWALDSTKNEGRCNAVAGAAAGSCVFGSPSSSIASAEGYQCRTLPGPNGGGCYPAFQAINRGFHLTVAIRVSWLSHATGAVLGRVDYYPTVNSNDIACASYAVMISRCSGPHASAPYNLFAPRNVGYLTMP